MRHFIYRKKNFFPIQILHCKVPLLKFRYFYSFTSLKFIFLSAFLTTQNSWVYFIFILVFSRYARYSLIFSILLKVCKSSKHNFSSNKFFCRCNILLYNYLYFKPQSEHTIYIALNYRFTILVKIHFAAIVITLFT